MSADSWARRVSGRMLARIALVAGSFATGACEDVCCLLHIDPAGADIDMPVAGWGAWDDADSVVTWHGSLIDSAGLAGMELEVLGQTVRARDFRNRRRTIRMPRYGTLHVFFRLADKGQQIAEGRVSWRLQPNDRWLLRIIRGPRDGGCPLPSWICDLDARLPIDDRFANYPGEAVWLMLIGVSGPGELIFPW